MNVVTHFLTFTLYNLHVNKAKKTKKKGVESDDLFLVWDFFCYEIYENCQDVADQAREAWNNLDEIWGEN
jgi:hypothetical protein